MVNNTSGLNYSLGMTTTQPVVIPVDTQLRGELIVESVSTTESIITFNLYNLEDNDTLLQSVSYKNTTPELQ
jgi:hypothetical protein